MDEKILKSRIINKHDIEENWSKATNFIPKRGEVIIYDIDSNYSYERIKIGDGVQNVNSLPFADAALQEQIKTKASSTNPTILGIISTSNDFDNGYSEIFKNNSADADYGTMIKDRDAEGNALSLTVSSELDNIYAAGGKYGVNSPIITTVDVDTSLSESSTNPVQNKVVSAAINNLNALVGDTEVSTQISDAIANKADSDHTHDDRYYTETEIDSKLADKSNTSHGHGLMTTSLAVNVADSTEGGWELIESTYDGLIGDNNGHILKSVRTLNTAPEWMLSNYAAGVAFGGGDTKGLITTAYHSPEIKFAGGNGSNPVWHMSVTGKSGENYDLSTIDDKVSKSGDTMTGNLTIDTVIPGVTLTAPANSDGKKSCGRVYKNASSTEDHGLHMRDYPYGGEDDDNYSSLIVNHSLATIEKLRLQTKNNGVSVNYKIYGEHNKPTPADIGAEVSGAAANALTEAKAYTDGLVGDTTVAEQISSAIDEATADDFGVYVQDTEPTDAVAGDIWIDTSSDPSFIEPNLPEVTEADNGKILMVVNGKWQAVTLNMSVDANGVLSV